MQACNVSDRRHLTAEKNPLWSIFCHTRCLSRCDGSRKEQGPRAAIRTSVSAWKRRRSESQRFNRFIAVTLLLDEAEAGACEGIIQDKYGRQTVLTCSSLHLIPGQGNISTSSNYSTSDWFLLGVNCATVFHCPGRSQTELRLPVWLRLHSEFASEGFRPLRIVLA